MSARRTPKKTPVPEPIEAGAATEPGAPSPERSVLEVMRAIKEGQTDPRLLAEEDRQTCVGHLSAEGLSVPEIASILKRSERTIQRDRDALRRAAALRHDPELADRMAGQLRTEAELAIERIRRVSRAPDTPPAVKVDAEHRCYQVFSDFVVRLQSLGYLPTAAHRVEAEMTHRRSIDPGQASAEIRRVCAIAVEVLPAGDPLRGQALSLCEATKRVGDPAPPESDHAEPA